MPSRVHKHLVEAHGVLVALHAPLTQFSLVDSDITLQSRLHGVGGIVGEKVRVGEE